MLAWPEAPPLELDDFVRVPSFDIHGDLALSLVHRVREHAARPDVSRRGRHARHGHDGGDGVPRRPAARHGDTRGAHRRAAGCGRAATPTGRATCGTRSASPRRRRPAVAARRSSFGGEIHAAREARKVHTSAVRAFGSPGYGPIGHVDGDVVALPAAARGGRPPLPLPERLAPVDLIRLHAGSDARFLRTSVESGAAADRARGHGPRNANCNDQVVAGVARTPSRRASTSPSAHAARKGASQPVYGRGGGRDLAEAGALFAGDLAGPKARVLLQVALGAGRRARRGPRGRGGLTSAGCRPYASRGTRCAKSSAISSKVAQRIAVVPVDVLDDPLVHGQHGGPAAHVGVDRHRVDGVVVLAVDPVELVEPELLDVARVDEAVAVRRRLDEHHRRQVVQVPAGRDLDQVGLLAALERHHPLLGLLRVVDLRPRVADADVVGLEVLVHERVVVLDPALEQELVGDVGELPPRRHVAGRALARHALDEVDALVEHGGLLLAAHRDRVLVGVAVDPDLVTRRDDLLGLARERLDRVAGDEPGRPELVPPEELEQARRPHLAREETARDVVRRVLATVGPEPPRDRVHVDAVRDEDLLGHRASNPIDLGC